MFIISLISFYVPTSQNRQIAFQKLVNMTVATGHYQKFISDIHKRFEIFRKLTELTHDHDDL